MIAVLIFINAVVVIHSIKAVNRMEVTPFKQKHIQKIHSYQSYFNIKDFVEKRYIAHTFLSEKIDGANLLGLWMLWCFTAVVLFSVLGRMTFLGVMLMLFIMALPILIMEKYMAHVDLSIDKGIFNLLTQINARLLKSEDILIALQEAQQTTTNKYILKIIKAFNHTVRLGMPPIQAFSRLQIATNNEYLKYLFINIEIVYMRRGNVQELMRALENEYTSIQIEINKRKVALEHEKNMTLFSMLMVVLTTVKIVKDNDYIMTFYRGSPFLIGVLALIVLLGIGFVVKASLTKY